jgi:hypothetical protein
MGNVAIYGSSKIFSFLSDSPAKFKFLENTELFEWSISGKEIATIATPEMYFLDSTPELIEKFRLIVPVFARHFDDLPRIELFIRELSSQTIALANALKKEGVTLVYLNTGASHWIESFIVQFACETASLPQIFPYPTIFQSRILPLIQFDGIGSRRLLGLKVSNKKTEEIIDYQTPSMRLATLAAPKGFTTDKLPVAYLLAIGYSTKRNLRQIRSWRLKSRSNYFRASSTSHGLAKTLQLLKSHKDAINFYQSEIGHSQKHTDEEVFLKSELLPIVIYAHFQPEATTFPEGGMFSDQIEMVSFIRGSGFKGHIFYKEHPNMFSLSGKYSNKGGVARSKNYYKQLKSLGVQFLNNDKEFDFPHIAATISGSVALERSLDGLETIVFGMPWFTNNPALLSPKNYFDTPYVNSKVVDREKIRQMSLEWFQEVLNDKTLSNFIGIGGYDAHPQDRDEELEWIEFFEELSSIEFRRQNS